jgi:hypothetical protein
MSWMAPVSPVDKIRALLGSDAHERQIAAAIVLGEVGARDATTIDALARAAEGGIPPVQRHALEALAKLAGGKANAAKVLPRILSGCASRDDQVRRAAVDAAVAFGDAAVTAVRKRLAESTDPTERRALEEVLGRVGGRDAFSALFAALDTPDVEAARAAALAVRQRIKDASPREKAACLAQVTKLVKQGAGKSKPSPALLTGGLKILGFLEDAAAIPTLLAFARDKRQPGPVREEAIVALRFVARGKAGGRVVPALADLAEKAPADLARAALYTMASLEVPSGLAGRLRKLALGREPERGLLAIERLAQIPGNPGADGLAAVLTATEDRMRAEAAANVLGGRTDGTSALARAFVAVRDLDRAALLARLMRPRLRMLAEGGPAGRKLARALVTSVLARIERDGSGAHGLLPLARELDREATSTGLRALAAKLQKRKDSEAALTLLRLVGHGSDASPEDGYALAAAELRAGRRDEALTIVQQLLERGYDVAAALRRDRLVTPAQRYQVGFVLVERRQPAGEEVLTDLARAGRNKIATMAKAKLKSAGYA